MIRKIWNHTWVRLTATFILTVTVAAYGALVFGSWHVTKPTQANGREIIASYNTVSAASATDYTWTSYLDAQTALNAVVAAGGGSLEFLGGAYNFGGHTVTATCNNIQITGVGNSTVFSNGGISAGTNSGWTFSNLATSGAGGITYSSATNVTLIAVDLNGTYIGMQTAGTVTATTLNAPTGRTASYVIAASNSSALDKSQADYVMPNSTADVGVIINTAFSTYQDVTLTTGNFSVSTTILDSSILNGSGWGWGNGTILHPINGFNSNVINLDANLATVSNLEIDGNKANQTSGDGIVGVYDKCVITNVYTYAVYGAGIHMTGAPSDTDIYSCRSDQCGIGIWCDSPNGGFNLSQDYITSSTIAGIKINSTWVNLGDSRITSCTGDGLLITDAGNGNGMYIVVNNCDIDGNGTNNIELVASANNLYGVTISNCTFADASLGSPHTYDDIYAHTANGKVIGNLDIHDNYYNDNSENYRIHADAGVYGQIHNENYQIPGFAGTWLITTANFSLSNNQPMTLNPAVTAPVYYAVAPVTHVVTGGAASFVTWDLGADNGNPCPLGTTQVLIQCYPQATTDIGARNLGSSIAAQTIIGAWVYTTLMVSVDPTTANPTIEIYQVNGTGNVYILMGYWK